MHPISGLDHVVLAVGMGMVFARHKKLGLGLLVTSLLLGFALVQLSHVAIGSSIIEGAILLSVVLTAAAVLAQRTKIAQANQKSFSLMMAISLFGLTLFHGMAHAVEMPVSSVSQGFGLGMITAMSALFAVGAGVMNWVKAQAHAYPKLSWLPSIMAALGMALVLAN
jgi:urease accessory protein